MSAFPLGTTVAAVLASVMLPSWRLMFMIAGIGVIVPILVVVIFFGESVEWVTTRSATAELPDVEKASAIVKIFDPENRRVTVLGTVMCSFALIAYWGASTWLPTFLHEDKGLAMTTVALFMTVLSLGMIFGYNAFGWISDRIGRKNAIILSLTGTGIILPFYVFATSSTTLLWLGPAFAFFAAFTALFGSYFAEIFPVDVRATGAGFCYNTGRGLSALAPFALGYSASVSGFKGGFLFCAASFLAAAAVMTLLPRSRDTTLHHLTGTDKSAAAKKASA